MAERRIVLSISLSGAEKLRQDLTALGPAGESALARLDAAAQKSGSGMQDASKSAVDLRYTVGQAGYQIQDFAVQVQGGTSALVALGQQGSQMLGIFGPAGAIAGAVLTIGTLAAQLFLARDAGEEAKKAQEALANAVKAAGDAMDTAAGKARRYALETNRAQQAALSKAVQDTRLEITEQQKDLDYLRQQQNTNYGYSENSRRGTLRPFTAELSPEVSADQQKLQERGELLQRRLAERETQLRALEEQQSRIEKAAAQGSDLSVLDQSFNSLSTSLDKRAAIVQKYNDNVLAIQTAGEKEGKSQEEISRLISLAAKQRDEAMSQLEASSTKGVRAAKASREAVDEELLEVSALVKQQNRQYDQLQQNLVDQAARDEEKARKAEEQAQKQLQQRSDRITDSIVDYSADRFADLFSENSKGWKGMLDTFEKTAKSTMARIAAELILRPIIAPVVSSLMGSTGLTSMLGLTGAGGQISSALGLNGIGSTVSGWLSTPLWSIGNQSAATTSALSSMGGVYGPATPSAVSAAGYSATGIGSLLGGAGLGFGAGSVLNTLARGNSTGGTVGSAAGGLAGAAIGSIVPGVGTGLGGLIGGAGGGLMGGLFGGGKGFSGGTIQVEVQDGQLVVAGTRSKGKADSSEAVAALQQQVTTLNTALSQRGLYLNAAGLVTEQGFGQDKRAADVSGVARAYLASDDPTIQTVIRNSLGSSLEAVLSDVDWAKSVYQPMVDAAKTSAVDASEFFVNLRAQTDPLNAAIDKARELGLATDDLAASLQKTTDAAYAARAATVSDIRNNLTQRSNTALGRNSLQDQIWSANVAGDIQVRQLESQLQSLGYTPGDANGRYAEVNQLLGVLAQETAALTRQYEQETAALTRQYEQQRAANDNGLWDRIQSASGAGNTLEGALWDYNRKATQEWLTATTDGMTDLTLLAKAQSEERLQIERNYAEQAAELARQEAEKAEALRQETLQSELSALQTLSSQSKVLTGWLDSQKLTSSLNSPSSALAEAQRQFSTALDAARTAGPGDADLSAVTSAASSVISAGSAYYGTGSGQAALEAMVRQSITSLGAQLDLPAFSDDVVGAVARLQAAQETGTATLAAKLDAIYAELRTQRLQRAA
ncbi:hypothetical protein ACI2KH_19940 [Roseomonas mucosa]|uniref:hypothetical protein n=1 Tax=Roseomonas mucosa TaxID=207340 RepID=UPI00384D682C